MWDTTGAISQFYAAGPTTRYNARVMAAWESGNDFPMVECIEGFEFAPDSLERRDSGCRKSKSDHIPV